MVMESKEELYRNKLDELLEDNTEQAIEINELRTVVGDKNFEIRKLMSDIQEEREKNIVIRDCVIKFSNETSLTGLIQICSEYLLHYYKPNLLTFYISNNVINKTDENEFYSHIYDFKTREDLETTKPVKLVNIFNQMVKSQQPTKRFSSFDLSKLDETETMEAVLCKIQYANKVIGFLLMEFVEETNAKSDDLINLLLEIFANNYSMLVVTNLLAERYDNALTQALLDMKTGIGNARQFQHDVEDLGETEYCILSIDIDDFKHVNDNYGHDAGDEVLKYVGQVVNKNMSKLNGKGYREGGDEFLGISLESLVETELAVKDTLDEIADHLFTDASGNTFSITNSAGLYKRKMGESLETVKKKVDILLYSSKQKGKKKYTVNQDVTID